MSVEEYKGCKITVEQDQDPFNPRTEHDNLATMICFHGRYDLGDKDHGYKQSDYSSWQELREAIEKDQDIAIILPLYLYDHSGITINTTGFSCPWDSGQIGFIYVTKSKLREEYSVKRVTSKTVDTAMKVLLGEVETYDQYLRGDVYAYSIEKDGETVDSLCGMYGLEYAMDEAKFSVDGYVQREADEQESKQLKLGIEQT